MSLINCPECGKEISDKSKQCIHCGYPLIKINNELSSKKYCVVLTDDGNNRAKCVIIIRKAMQCDLDTAYNVVLKHLPYTIINNINYNDALTLKQEFEDIGASVEIKDSYIKSKPLCPKCGCTEFVPLRRKFSLLTGFATNKVDMVCKNCGWVRK